MATIPVILRFGNKNLFKIFVILQSLAILMLLSNYLIYKNAINGLDNEIEANNTLVVRSIVQSFDSSFKDINNLIYTIQSLPFNVSDNETDLDKVSAYMLWKDLKNAVSSSNANDYIENVVVYYKHSEIAITKDGTIGLKQLFSREYQSDKYNYDFWRTLANSPHALKVFPEESYKVTAEFEPVNTNFIAIAANNQVSTMNVVMFINPERLLKHVSQEIMMDGTSLMILDQNQQVILGNGGGLNLVDLLRDVHQGQTEAHKKMNFDYFIYKSDYNGFTYIEKVPLKYAELKSVTNNSRLILLITLGLDLLISAALSIYLFKPYLCLSRLIQGREDRNANFESIAEGIRHMREELQAYQAKFNKKDAEMLRGITMFALEEGTLSRHFEARMAEYFAPLFEYPQFMMAELLVSERDGDLYLLPQAEELLSLLKAELQGDREEITIVQIMGRQFLLLIGVSSADKRKYWLESLRNFLVRPKSTELARFAMRAYVGRIYKTQQECWHTAYLEIARSKQLRYTDDSGPLYDAALIAHRLQADWSLMKLEKLSHAIVGGKGDEAACLALEILEENEHAPVHHYQLLLMSRFLYGFALGQLEFPEGERIKLAEMEQTFFEKTEQMLDYKEVKSELVNLIQMISEEARNTSKSKMNPTFISQYIELHYMDNLDLNHMADLLDTSPKYFSNSFKKTFGINFVEYLNKVRMHHAKEYLMNTELSIGQVGDKLGYLSSSTFTTTFKKYTGVSPSEYRKRS